jgi:hypothetical protein
MGGLTPIAQKTRRRSCFLSLEPFFFFFNKRVAAIAKVRNERNVKQGSIVLRIEVEVE